MIKVCQLTLSDMRHFLQIDTKAMHVRITSLHLYSLLMRLANAASIWANLDKIDSIVIH